MKAADLSFLGVSAKSARIYLAGLLLGTTSVQELARKSGLKRPTVYVHLDELLEAGLFESVPANGKRYYRAVDPNVVEEKLKLSLAQLQSELPKLSAMRSDMMGKPQVRLFEGTEAIKHTYARMKKANSWRVWSNVGSVYGPFHDTYMDMCEAVRKNGIGVREIIADTKESRRYARLVSKVAGPTYSARVATAEGLENDAFIFDNTVALFRLHELNMFVVCIEDKTIADSMKALFDMAWRSAKAFR